MNRTGPPLPRPDKRFDIRAAFNSDTSASLVPDIVETASSSSPSLFWIGNFGGNFRPKADLGSACIGDMGGGGGRGGPKTSERERRVARGVESLEAVSNCEEGDDFVLGGGRGGGGFLLPRGVESREVVSAWSVFFARGVGFLDDADCGSASRSDPFDLGVSTFCIVFLRSSMRFRIKSARASAPSASRALPEAVGVPRLPVKRLGVV